MTDNEFVVRDAKPHALITGASRGIGEAIARTLAAEGYDLTITCKSDFESLQRLADELTGNRITTGGENPGQALPDRVNSVRVTPVCVDVADSEAVKVLIGSFDRLDVLINNAGISLVGLMQDMTDAEWESIRGVNLDGVFYTCRAAIPLLLQSRGRILNISSVWGTCGASCEAAYSATKGGVNTLTKALGRELAPSGVPVNAICCGFVDTAMNGHLTDEDREELKGQIPADRFAAPEEVAEMVSLLLKAPDYLTAQTITFDGGWT